MSYRNNTNDSRYPRDRSPPRNDRRASYASAAPFSSARDAPPRGPRALESTGPRGSSIPAGPRGRGFTGRTELRDAPPLTDTRDRRWNNNDRDRDFDRRDRRPSPRSRSPQRDSRGARDFPPREIDVRGAQRAARDGPPSAGSNYSDPPHTSGIWSSRGGFRGSYRGGRGDWSDHHGRGRGHFNEDRDNRDNYRARSRSRGPWRENNSSRDDRDIDRRDDRRLERREDDRRYRDRDEKDDRYKPNSRIESYNADSRNIPSGSASPHCNKPLSAESNSDRFPDNAGSRDFPASRRSSLADISSAKETRREEKADLPPGRTELPRERLTGRGSPPPQAPSVPAFGSIPSAVPGRQNSFAGQTSNVWRASHLDNRPVQEARAPANTTSAKGFPHAPPTAPKALSTVTMPPTGPKATRSADRPESRESRETVSNDDGRKDLPTRASPGEIISTSALPLKSEEAQPPPPLSASPPSRSRICPTGPSAVNNGPRVTALTDSSTPANIPSGPRNAWPAVTSPKAMNSVIPTGPRAERLGPNAMRQQGVHGSPPFTKSRQWIRPDIRAGVSAANPITRPGFLVPAKRDSEGEEKERTSLASLKLATDVQPPVIQISQRTIETKTEPKVEPSEDRVMIDVTPSIDMPPLSANPSAPEGGDDLSEDEDGLFDEGDFEAAEQKFLEEKKRVESLRQNWSEPSSHTVAALEQIMLIDCITMDDIGYVRSLNEEEHVSSEPVGKTSTIIQPEILTPKEESMGDESMLDADAPDYRESSMELEPTPDVATLPFLCQAPPTPLSDRGHYFRNIESPSEDTIQRIKHMMVSKLDTHNDVEEATRREFYEQYCRWRQLLDEWDAAHGVEEEEQPVPDEPRAAVTPDPATVPSALPTPSIGRARGFISQYQLDLIMKDSLKIEEERQAKLEREAKQSKPDMEKEAEIPDLLEDDSPTRRPFNDTTRLRESTQALRCFGFDPPADDFDEEEHKILVNAYHQNPKKWGYIASYLKKRNFQQCINHYYHTKWAGEFKPKVKGRKARSKAAKTGASRGRAPLNSEALSRYENGEDGPSAVTEKGRPRRAAAPQFGMDNDSEANATASTAGRRLGQAGDGPAEPRGTKRTRAPKEKVARKPRNNNLAPAPATSPIKQAKDRLEKQLGVKQEDLMRAESTEPGMYESAPLTYGAEDIQQTLEDGMGQIPFSAPHTMPTIPANPPRMQAAPSQRQGHSSYWSVQETADFRKNVAYFGTNFTLIANHMGTKTMVMVNEPSHCSSKLQQTHDVSHSSARLQQTHDVSHCSSRLQQPHYISYPSQSLQQTRQQVPMWLEPHANHNADMAEQHSNYIHSNTDKQVKNQYLRTVEQGKDDALRKQAEEADQRMKSGATLGPPPTPTLVAPRRRYDTTTSITAPRTLAPASDVDVDLPTSATMVAPAHSPPQLHPANRYTNTSQGPSSRLQGTPGSHGSPPMGPLTDPPQTSPPHHQSQYQPHSRPPPRMGGFESPQSRPLAQPPSTQPLHSAPLAQAAHSQSQFRAPAYGRPENRPETQSRLGHGPLGQGSPPFRHTGLPPSDMEGATKHQPAQSQLQHQPLQPQPQQQQQQQTHHQPPTTQERPIQARTWSVQDRPPYQPLSSRQAGPPVAPPQPMTLARSTGPPSSAELQPRGVPAQQTPLAPLHRSHSSIGRMESPAQGPPPSLSRSVAERGQMPCAREEPRASSIPAPPAPSSSLPPPKPAAETTRKSSNLFSLLNPAPENEESKPPKRENEHSLSAPRPPPTTISPGVQPAPAPSQSRQAPYGESMHQSYPRPGYGASSQIPSRPPSRSVVDTTLREPSHGGPRDSWTQRAYPGTQTSLSQNNSPMSAHPPPSSLSDSRMPLYPVGHSNQRANAFSQHNQPRHNPSPPPPHAAYAHSRGSSYSQAPQQPSSQAPSRLHTPPVGGPPVLHSNPYARVQPPGTSSAGPSSLATSQQALSDRSHTANQGLPYPGPVSETTTHRGLNINDRFSRESQEHERNVQRSREIDLQRRQEQERVREMQEREYRERDSYHARERERQEREQQHMRYSQHTPVGGPTTAQHDRFGPPPPPPGRGTPGYSLTSADARAQQHTPGPLGASAALRGPPLGDPRDAPSQHAPLIRNDPFRPQSRTTMASWDRPDDGRDPHPRRGGDPRAEWEQQEQRRMREDYERHGQPPQAQGQPPGQYSDYGRDGRRL